jgi:hypothetical protein
MVLASRHLTEESTAKSVTCCDSHQHGQTGRNMIEVIVFRTIQLGSDHVSHLQVRLCYSQS